MKNRIFSIGAAVLLFPLTSTWAADLTGNWIAQIPNRYGVAETDFRSGADGEKLTFPRYPFLIEAVFNFKVNGEKLTGKVTTPDGDAVISQGKIDGDKISFIVNRSIDGEQITQRYKGRLGGRVYGDEIEFICEIEGAKEILLKFIAKREFPMGDYYLPKKGIFPPTSPEN